VDIDEAAFATRDQIWSEGRQAEALAADVANAEHCQQVADACDLPP